MKMIKSLASINKNKIQGLQMEVHTGKPVLVISMSDETVGFGLKDGFAIFFSKEFLKSLNLLPDEYVIYNNFEQFNSTIQFADRLIHIQKELNSAGSDVAAHEIYDIMLDGFEGQNLVTKSEQENDLHKYVMIALNLFNKINMKVGA